ncbi:MAG: sigma-70 family RNA polymerase sigma factor [Burkholderiales bacterium]|nr:sigma-70 family RNA polymerase sigma factor [Burkholderiales bacterium]
MSTPAAAFESQVAEARAYLLRFARLQLRNDAWAEDCVSETILAALARPQAFGNRSQLRTWLVGILKHKVQDALRARAREVVRGDGDGDDGDDGDGGEELDRLAFQPDGHFVHAPADWGNPEESLGSAQFLRVLEACVEKLPPAMGRVFLMREWLELSTDEIRNEIGITATNLFVLLHRARLRLRECLELNWLGRH